MSFSYCDTSERGSRIEVKQCSEYGRDRNDQYPRGLRGRIHLRIHKIDYDDDIEQDDAGTDMSDETCEPVHNGECGQYRESKENYYDPGAAEYQRKQSLSLLFYKMNLFFHKVPQVMNASISSSTPVK